MLLSRLSRFFSPNMRQTWYSNGGWGVKILAKCSWWLGITMIDDVCLDLLFLLIFLLCEKESSTVNQDLGWCFFTFPKHLMQICKSKRLFFTIAFSVVLQTPCGGRMQTPQTLPSTWLFPKIGVPQIIHFNRVFHYKPSIFGVPLFLETSTCMYIFGVSTLPLLLTTKHDSLIPFFFELVPTTGHPWNGIHPYMTWGSANDGLVVNVDGWLFFR